MKIGVEKVATLKGHNDAIYAFDGAASENMFFSGAGDGMVASWDLEAVGDGKLVVKVPSSVYAVCYVKERNWLIVGQNFKGVHAIDLNNNKELFSSAITEAAIFDIKVNKNNVFVACGDGKVVVVGMDDFTVLAKLQHSNKSARSIAINTDSEEFAVGYSDNYFRVFDLNNFALKYEIKGHENSVFSVVYTPDKKLLLSGGRDAHLKVWGVESNYSLKESVVAHMYAINHIVFSRDGHYFATCSMDKSIKVWDAHTIKLLKVIDKARHAGHGTSVNKLFWSDYKGQLVSCSDDRTISVWNIKFNP